MASTAPQQPPTSTTAPGMGEKQPNPASLSMDPKKKVPRNKPQVDPPFKDVSFGRFMTYLTLGLLLLSGYYTWKLTHWAADAGGYWNLATGYRPPPGQAAADAAASAAAAAAAAAANNDDNDQKASLHAAASGLAAGGDTDAQLAEVAEKLGYTPEQLKQALKMLNILDPKGDGAAAAAQADAAKAAGAAAGAAAVEVVEEDVEPHPGLLHIVGEALLD